MKEYLYPPFAIQSPSYLDDYYKKHNMPLVDLKSSSVETIRAAQQQSLIFPEMRSIMLAPKTINDALKSSLLKNLLITRVGYCSEAKEHYIPRPEGSMDYVIHFCLKGKGWYRNEYGSWVVKPYQALMIPKNIPHAYGADNKEPWSIHWLHCTGELVHAFFQRAEITSQNPLLNLSALPAFTQKIEQIYNCLKQVHHEDNLLEASGILFQLLSEMGASKNSHELTHKSHDQIEQSLEFMQENIDKNLTIKQLAQSASLSISRYSYLFKNLMEISPVEYFNRLRIQQAAQELLTTGDSISEISQRLGYEDPYYFSKSFKKQMGVAPKFFRKNQ